MRLLATLAAATAAPAALTLPAHADPGPLGGAGGTLALPLKDAVEVLPAAQETRAGNRTWFRHV